jgi:hypothetical protein
LSGSQLYHFDREDRHQVQFIFAVTDVDQNNGPFTLITADKASLINSIIPEVQSRKTDSEVYGIIDPSSAIQLIGPSGSGWIADNSRCLHYGSRGNQAIRCHLQIQYVSKFSSAETELHLKKIKVELPEKLCKLQKLVVSGLNFI